jgi:hypothetical protein
VDYKDDVDDLPPLQHLQPGGPGVIHGTHIHVPCERESLWAAVPRVETLIFEHNLSAGAGDSPVHHSIAQKASLNGRTEHRLEAYATLTPSRRQRGFTAIATRMALRDRSTVRKTNVA